MSGRIVCSILMKFLQLRQQVQGKKLCRLGNSKLSFLVPIKHSFIKPLVTSHNQIVVYSTITNDDNNVVPKIEKFLDRGGEIRALAEDTVPPDIYIPILEGYF